MRCANCQARNPDGAAWCSQCYAPLRTPSPAEPPSGAQPSDAAGGVEPQAVEAAEAVENADGRVRQGEEGFEWRCATCDGWAPLEASSCPVCGAPFRLEEREERDIVDRPPAVVLGATLALPGSGHLLLGSVVDGVVRAVTYVAWLGGGILLLLRSPGVGATSLPAMTLLLGAIALLGLSVVDAARLAAGSRDQLLTPRVYLWLVVGVLGLLVIGFVPAVARVGELGV